MDYFVYVLLAITAVVIIARFIVRPVTIVEYRRGLLYSKGRFVRVLGPGRHWLYGPTSSVQMVDVRPRFRTIAGQEVLSSDGITLKVSLAAQYEITDPAKAINENADYEESFYLTLQMALRSIIGSATIDELLEKRDQFGPRVAEIAGGSIEEIGLRLVSVDIKDIMLPGDVKKLFAQIVKARKDAMAALERARGETAALRNLANAAKLMEENPSLLQLRALQQIGDTTGNTLVLGLPNHPNLVPVSPKRTAAPKDSDPEVG